MKVYTTNPVFLTSKSSNAEKSQKRFLLIDESFRKTLRIQVTHLVVVLCVIVLVSGCGTLQNGRKWGQDATIFPGWQRIGNAALKAARAPATWAPALGALGFQIGDLDEQVSNWASDNTPVFGSIKNAKTQSDFLRELLLADYLITALATPSGQQPGEWVVAKAKGISVGYVALASTRNTTGFLKGQTDRTRPDGRGDDSFPSNHASTSAVMAMLASKNIDSLPISDVYKTSLKIGTFSLDAGAAWARVEGERHYPSDVLAGMALGHFFGAFFNDAFLGLDQNEQIGLTIEPSMDGPLITFHWIF
jgi:membrane-associated phospholipid phosphatase